MTEKDNNTDSEANTKFKDGVNRNARLIVRNVSFKATEESLKEHFSQYGNVEEVNLLKKPDGRLVGCAFIHYTHVPTANKALSATNKKPFLGRPIYVSWAVPQNKFNEQIQSNDLKRQNKFDEQVPNNGLKRRFNKSNNDKESIDVKNEQKHEPVKEEKDKIRFNRNARLIVRNISFKVTDESLKEHFNPYGEVQEVKILKKPDGRLVGCAFVQFKNVPMAIKAIKNTNLKPFLDRPISVDWAAAKNKYMQHVVSKQIEMESEVKKEDSSDDDDDDGDAPLNISGDDLKKEVKSESEDDSDDDDGSDSDSDDDDKTKVKKDDSDVSDNDGGDDDGEDDEEEDDEQEDDDDKSVTSTNPEIQRKKLNDAEDGCTVFLTNIAFNVDDDLLKMFAEKTGPVKYALICVDRLTEHSKGSGFIKFVNKEDADRFLALPADELRLEGQLVQVRPALKKENLQTTNKKQPKDNRNLYLVKEGVVVAGTKAAVGVSASDMSKRLALERSKTQMLKNLNRFVSRYRIVVSNLPQNYDDAGLRRVCARAVGSKATLTEARVMRDLRAPVMNDGKHPSKGYGFVMFTRHEDALACLRKLNNNPDIFDKNNRPIVSFSIEDRTALNARKKRLEKSIANNPLAQTNQSEAEKRRNRKRKNTFTPDESYMKKGRFEKKNYDKTQNGDFGKNQNGDFGKNQNGDAGKYVRRPIDNEEYTGLTAKEGSQHKMRSGHKLKTQADLHRQNVKLEKKKSKRAMRLKMAARERIKQPKQKINKNKVGKRNKKRKFNQDII